MAAAAAPGGGVPVAVGVGGTAAGLFAAVVGVAVGGAVVNTLLAGRDVRSVGDVGGGGGGMGDDMGGRGEVGRGVWKRAAYERFP